MIKFKKNVELTIVEEFDEANDNITSEVQESFKKGEFVDADICGEDITEEYADLQFGDGSVAFTVKKDLFEVVED